MLKIGILRQIDEQEFYDFASHRFCDEHKVGNATF